MRISDWSSDVCSSDLIGPGAAQSGVLHRLVRVDRDAMLRGALHDVEMVAHHILAREPLHPASSILDRPAVADIAGLDQRHAVVGVEFQRGVQLPRIIFDPAAGFMMADQLDPLRLAVARDLRKVEIGIGAGEAELVAIGDPVAVPTLIPPLDEHAVESILGGEVRSEEHTSELQSLMRNSYAVFCLKKKHQPSSTSRAHYHACTAPHK